MLKIQFFIVFLIAGAAVRAQDGYRIDGHIALDESWNPVVYLSLIEAFDELTTISSEMIIAEAVISDEGEYSFEGEYLPDGDRIYRVHVCKKGDPISTIIIGGQEHNYAHFAMKPGDHISLESANGQVFRDVHVQGNAVNEYLIATNEILDRNRTKAVNSTISGSLRGEEAAYELLELIQTCEVPLCKHYAAYYLLDRFDKTSALDQFADLVDLGADTDSPYYEEIVDLAEYKLPALAQDRLNGQLVGLLAVVPIAFLLAWWLIQRSGSKDEPDPLADLSVQERKVLNLLANGLSNKEISSELGIGVSTVKSHVHRVFKKLQIKSRKEVYQFREHLRADQRSTTQVV